MEKVTVLFCSPNKNGSTANLLNTFMSGCPYNTKKYDIYSLNIKPCIGCNHCEQTGKCIINDDMNTVLSDIFSSEYVIFASPVYNYSFPSPMKAFLDRLQPLFFSNNYKISECNRKGFLLAAAGKSGRFSREIMEKQTKLAFEELSAEFCGSFFQTNTDKSFALQYDECCKVNLLSKKFFDKHS